jgi:hypothetical protein
MMRTLALFLAVATLGLALPAAAGGGEGAPRGGAAVTAPQGFYFGRIAFHDAVLGIDVRRGQRTRVLVTDAEPGGVAEWFDGRARDGRLDLVSASGDARLRLRIQRRARQWVGTITLPGGTTRSVAALLAGEGAGLYDIRVSRDGRYSGRSIDGKRLSARRDGRFVTGTISERGEEPLDYRVVDLSQAFDYRIRSGRPGTYTAIVSRNGTLHYGRGGGDALKRGRPGRNLIALDFAPSAEPTPGFFFGRLGFSRAVVGVKLDPPDANGARPVRIYTSDSEPEPRGEIEWFTGTVTGSAFRLRSASRRARISVRVEDDFVSGTITFASGRRHRFFALPAGEGAGIYEVTITRDGRIRGTSEEGATLDARQVGNSVRGTITTPSGQRFDYEVADLTRALSYRRRGNRPGRYVAVAAPRGRFFFGRNGDVRGGRPGINIIGLDKAC